MSDFIRTIGYAGHTRDSLLARLKIEHVTAVADIRTYKNSSYWTAFDSDSFGSFLRDNGIAYVFLGDQLGGKPRNPALYPDGKLDYERMAATDGFQAGLDRLERGASKFELCIMCAEKDPMDCHRGLIVAPEMQKRGMDFRHLLADGSSEPHAETEARMIAATNTDGPDLFADPSDTLYRAYAAQRRRCAPNIRS
jgi:uncharacterized protein (DUF488 family)